MATYYQAVPSAHFASGFVPTHPQREKMDRLVFDRCSEIVQIAHGWSENATIFHAHPGFGIGDLVTAFRNCLKGKRGYTVSKLEGYRDPNPDCRVNTVFYVTVGGDGWWSRNAIYVEVEFGEGESESEDEVRYLDRFDAVVIQSGMRAADADAFNKMVRWWTTVDPAKANT